MKTSPVSFGLARARSFESRLSRHPAKASLVTAFVLRSSMAVIVRITSGGSLFLDDASYLRSIERAVSSGRWTDESLWTTTPSLFRPAVLLNDTLFHDPITSQVFVAVVGSATCALTCLTVLNLTNVPTAALRAGLTMAIFPSAIFWSSIVLKDSLVWLGISGTLWSISLLCKRPRQTRPPLHIYAVSCATFAGSLAITYGSRPHSALLLVLTIGATAIFVARPKKLVIPMAILFVAFAPMTLGYGPMASRILENGSRSFAENRSAEVSQAETALSCLPVPILGAGDPAAGGWKNDLLCLPSSLAMFLTMPWPNQVLDNTTLAPPLLEFPAWLALFWVALRHPRRLWSSSPASRLVLIHLIVTIAFWSTVDRVVGTAFRHRSELLVGLVVLAFCNSKLAVREMDPTPDQEPPSTHTPA